MRMRTGRGHPTTACQRKCSLERRRALGAQEGEGFGLALLWCCDSELDQGLESANVDPVTSQTFLRPFGGFNVAVVTPLPLLFTVSVGDIAETPESG